MDKELLKQIEDYAEIQFNAEQIADVMDVPEVTAALAGSGKVGKDDKEAILKAAKRGWLRGEADCRKAVKREAENGSASAQKIMLELVWQRQQDEGKEE